MTTATASEFFSWLATVCPSAAPALAASRSAASAAQSGAAAGAGASYPGDQASGEEQRDAYLAAVGAGALAGAAFTPAAPWIGGAIGAGAASISYAFSHTGEGWLTETAGGAMEGEVWVGQNRYLFGTLQESPDAAGMIWSHSAASSQGHGRMYNARPLQFRAGYCDAWPGSVRAGEVVVAGAPYRSREQAALAVAGVSAEASGSFLEDDRLRIYPVTQEEAEAWLGHLGWPIPPRGSVIFVAVEIYTPHTPPYEAPQRTIDTAQQRPQINTYADLPLLVFYLQHWGPSKLFYFYGIQILAPVITMDGGELDGGAAEKGGGVGTALLISGGLAGLGLLGKLLLR